jgi:hypothetical protein
MKDNRDNPAGTMLPDAGNSRLEGRIFRAMALATLLATVISLPFAHWRITTGVLLGGILALLNHYWLSNSTAAAFTVLVHGAKPRLSLVQYLLRYLVIATVVFIAYKLNLVSVVATLIGLCSFVVALFAEAFREFYFAIIHREEAS